MRPHHFLPGVWTNGSITSEGKETQISMLLVADADATGLCALALECWSLGM
jgi:hypothetical protein